MIIQISWSLCFLLPTVGYVKTTSVEIDFNTLKNCSAQQQSEPEVYDDIDLPPPDNRYWERRIVDKLEEPFFLKVKVDFLLIFSLQWEKGTRRYDQT